MNGVSRVGVIATGLLLAVLVSSARAEITVEELKNLPGLNKMVWVRAPQTANAPTIDGTLDLAKGEWADAPCIYGMQGWRAAGGYLLPIPSWSYITWDKENFYLGVRTNLLPGQVLRRGIRDDEDQVHRDDCLELFFDPLERDQPERAHFQVMFNSLGACWDAMLSVGVTAKYWNGNWTMKSDYEVGMDHFDAEIVVPIKSMRIKGANEPGQCWRFLVCRDWKNLINESGKAVWNIYSSFTGWGAFSRPESYGALILDDDAVVVQLLDLSLLWSGKFGLKARVSNPSKRPVTCLATAKVFKRDGKLGAQDMDWMTRSDPLAEAREPFSLEPGSERIWTPTVRELPVLDAEKDKTTMYDFVMTVTSADGKRLYFRRQTPFKKVAYAARTYEYSLPMSVAYNPVRNNIWVTCDVLDDPNRARARGVRAELFATDADIEKDKPLVSRRVTTKRREVFQALIDVPALKPGTYAVRLTLLGDDDKPLGTKELSVEKLDEAEEFKWWESRAGITEKPIPPHKGMRYEGDKVVTTMGEFTFGGTAMPTQIKMTGRELLASPIRLTASVGGKAIAFASPGKPTVTNQSPMEANMSGSLSAQDLAVTVTNHLEYDGAMRVTLEVEPKPKVHLDYLRLEIPFKPERGQLLWTMARAGRESWVAAELTKGEGVVWDSRNCRGYGMTVGTFMPQYVVSDSVRGLCWFADSDRGWVPTDDVPMTEVLRDASETVLRFNLIAKPFSVKSKRRIEFWLMGLPARPLPGGWRIYHRNTSNFGHYVGDKVMNYSPPLPRDFAKARDFVEKGTLYDSKTFEPKGKSGKWNLDFEFAPWHDSHNPFKTPDLNEKTYSYFGLEFGSSFGPTITDLRCYQLDRYCRETPLAGIYFDTPEGMGFSKNLSNGTAYVIPEGQPKAGEIQPGYNIVGFREYLKRVRGLFWQNGRDNPWIEMHSTHGPIAPCTPFMDVRTEGEDYRTPTHRHFMNAWTRPHLRAIDVPPLFGMVTRWLSGYPWDGSVKGADPQRCKIGACILHDVFSHWGRWTSTRVYKDQAPVVRPRLWAPGLVWSEVYDGAHEKGADDENATQFHTEFQGQGGVVDPDGRGELRRGVSEAWDQVAVAHEVEEDVRRAGGESL